MRTVHACGRALAALFIGKLIVQELPLPGCEDRLERFDVLFA